MLWLLWLAKICAVPLLLAAAIYSICKRSQKRGGQRGSQRGNRQRIIEEFNNTTYHRVTNNSYFETLSDAGKTGEYLIFRGLQAFEREGAKFLFNVYLPKRNGGTTEIDVILIAPKGIIVFESKNYSGWIFGDENQKNWTQTLPQGRGECRKEHFLNPVVQNNLHIKSLNNVIGKNHPVYSIIVFSERCTLKNITLYSEDVQVIKIDDIYSAVNGIFKNFTEPLYSEDEIQRMYDILYPYSQVGDDVKREHIAAIRDKYFD